MLKAVVRVDRPVVDFPAMLAAPICVAVLACLIAAPEAAAAPTLSWSTPLKIDSGHALTAVSCATQTLCAAVDDAGGALVSTNPGAGSGAAWPRLAIDGVALTGVSCASSALCVAVDGEGHALVSTDPGAGASTKWSNPREIDGNKPITGVSCASSALCVAVDGEGHALVSTDPAAGSWSSHTIDQGHALTGVACAPGLPCVAVDNGGRVLASGEPAGSWSARQVDGAALTAVACAPAPAGECVAVDETGEELASANPGAGLPGAGAATWSATPVAAAPLAGATCSAAGLCVLADGAGDTYAGDDPAAIGPLWKFESIDSPAALAGVSCTAEGLCVAADNAGRVLIARVPRPIVSTTAPSPANVAETTAQLSGTVDTGDATVTSCRFEYGTSEAYGQSAPCSPLGAGSAGQPVSALLSGLAPGVTYDYRLVAVSASGEGRSANTTFKTLAPPLVQPHPSISGIPARGQQLTCRPGVSGSGASSATASSATITYAWLRDTRAIGGANDQTYTVQSADVSHHLQCRVTATNAAGSATATSGFVTVPAGGLGSISETQVGVPRVAGRTVSMLVICSPQAAGSCAIAVRLSVVETLRGNRPIAVAAARRPAATLAAARRVRHVTVTVGASGARIPAGQQRTVTVTLNATGRSLLARRHRLPAQLSVRGTVVGALIAPLRSATVTLGGAGKAAAGRTHSYRRPR